MQRKPQTNTMFLNLFLEVMASFETFRDLNDLNKTTIHNFSRLSNIP